MTSKSTIRKSNHKYACGGCLRRTKSEMGVDRLIGRNQNDAMRQAWFELTKAGLCPARLILNKISLAETDEAEIEFGHSSGRHVRVLCNDSGLIVAKKPARAICYTIQRNKPNESIVEAVRRALSHVHL